MPPYLLTDAQVQDILHISRTTLWRLRQEGKLRPKRMGNGRLVYRQDEVERVRQKRARAGGGTAATGARERGGEHMIELVSWRWKELPADDAKITHLLLRITCDDLCEQVEADLWCQLAAGDLVTDEFRPLFHFDLFDAGMVDGVWQRPWLLVRGVYDRARRRGS